MDRHVHGFAENIPTGHIQRRFCVIVTDKRSVHDIVDAVHTAWIKTQKVRCDFGDTGTRPHDVNGPANGGKSTKGASKMRRDLINGEIAVLRDLLPLPSSTRQRLSQLQLMALVCVYVRKSNYFDQGVYG